MTDAVENRILTNSYDLFDKALYGGLGHGVIVFPTHIFKVIFTIIFPPLGEILNAIEDLIFNKFPYITWNTIIKLFDVTIITRIIYSYLLTSLFYVPGLIYTLSKLTISSSGIKGTIVCDPDSGKCADSAVFTPPPPSKTKLT